MTRYVIGPDVAIRLARDQAVIRGGHQILAPALLRSQVLPLLYQAVRRGEMTRKDAERHLEYARAADPAARGPRPAVAFIDDVGAAISLVCQFEKKAKIEGERGEGQFI